MHQEFIQCYSTKGNSKHGPITWYIDHLYVLALKAWLEHEQSGACEVNPSKVKKNLLWSTKLWIWMDLDGFLWRTSGIYSFTWFSPVFLCWSICNASVFAWKSTWRGHDLVQKKPCWQSFHKQLSSCVSQIAVPDKLRWSPKLCSSHEQPHASLVEIGPTWFAWWIFMSPVRKSYAYEALP